MEANNSIDYLKKQTLKLINRLNVLNNLTEEIAKELKIDDVKIQTYRTITQTSSKRINVLIDKIACLSEQSDGNRKKFLHHSINREYYLLNVYEDMILQSPTFVNLWDGEV